MFEGSLVESRGLVVSGTKRWTALGSAVFQCGVAGLLVAFSLMHPAILPMHVAPPQLVVPVSRPPIPQARMEAASSSLTTSVAVASVAPVASAVSLILRPTGGDVGPAPAIDTGMRMGSEPMGNALLGIAGPAPNVSALPAKRAGPVNVSLGVAAGMLLAPIRPVYPAIARATRTEGTVVLEAVISKAGRIESLHVVSGPAMLREAALDAVQAARYQPYKLNGEATEVQTTITVNFRLEN